MIQKKKKEKKNSSGGVGRYSPHLGRPAHTHLPRLPKERNMRRQKREKRSGQLKMVEDAALLIFI